MGIPRQEKKFAEDNPNGKKGSRWLTILGLKYDLADLTIAISKTRVLEIMAEMKSILAKKFATKLKQWESTIGVISWTTTAIPQIKMFLTGSWRLIQAVKAKSKNKNQRIKMIKDIEHDWKEIIYQLETWNGCQKIMRERWDEPNELGYDAMKGTIDPASDASGEFGWGAICNEGYAHGTWSEKERPLAIHIKEGLALFALIKLFGKKLCRKQVKVRLTLRCDNASIVSALDKGRAKNVNLAIIIRLIVRAMIEAGTILKFWKTGKEKVARVEYISSKGNILYGMKLEQG